MYTKNLYKCFLAWRVLVDTNATKSGTLKEKVRLVRRLTYMARFKYCTWERRAQRKSQVHRENRRLEQAMAGWKRVTEGRALEKSMLQMAELFSRRNLLWKAVEGLKLTETHNWFQNKMHKITRLLKQTSIAQIQTHLSLSLRSQTLKHLLLRNTFSRVREISSKGRSDRAELLGDNIERARFQLKRRWFEEMYEVSKFMLSKDVLLYSVEKYWERGILKKAFLAFKV